jgi:MoaA/NifB/PqqE/SkfB family radical SAM enzyme
MCNPATSSNWYSDGYKLAVKYENVTESFPQWTKNFEHIKNGFSSNNKQFWSDFDEWLPNLVFVDIYGGEPFLSNRLFESLKKVSDTGEASNISLQMHTNGTFYNEDYLNILSKFKNVSLNLSVDSHKVEHNNYIRYPVDGAQLLENVLKFKKYIDNHKNNIDLGITVTFNTINIYHFSDIVTELSKIGTNIGPNFVNDPIEYDLRILPREVKEKIIEKNKTIDTSLEDYIMQEIPDSDNHLKKFWQITKDLDEFRNQNFESTFPEYYNILKNYI